jgi:Fe-S cluster assembly protein SufD
MPTLLPKTIPISDKESWKYSNINAALKKLEVVAKPCAWELSGASEFMMDNKTIVIPKNKQVTRPIEMKLHGLDKVHFETDFNLLVESGAEVVLLERQSGEGAYWKNIDLNITLGANATLHHYRFCEEDPFCVTTERTTITQGRDSSYHMMVVNGCAGLGRAEFKVLMQEAGAECDLAGLTLLAGKQHSDITICVDHIAPHCRSSQFFKTILNDGSRGVYQGKIHVHKDAQKTDGYQLSNNLLLSNLAEMDVKPELEIYADDVKCSHGSTTGQLDETPLFYLMSRGISKDDARRLLLEAFMGEVLDKISHEDIRAIFSERVRLWLK